MLLHPLVTECFIPALSQLYLTPYQCHTPLTSAHFSDCILIIIFNRTFSDFSDKMFPAFGFGAQIPPDFKVSHFNTAAAIPVPSSSFSQSSSSSSLTLLSHSTGKYIRWFPEAFLLQEGTGSHSKVMRRSRSNT